MSELQITLLLIAAALLAALYLAGKWQERRLLRKLAREFGGGVGDALLNEASSASPGAADAAAGSRRIEPTLAVDIDVVQPAAADPAQAAPVPPAAARPAEWVEDPMLDCVLELRCARPVDGVALIDAAMSLTSAQWPLPVWFVAWDARAQQWVHPDRFGYYSEALAAIQLANRRHVLDEEQLGRFVGMVRAAAGALDADCDPPDVARMAAAALELDHLCARFDVRIGLTLEAASEPWSAHRVAAAALQLGLQTAGPARWTPPHPQGPAPFVLSMAASLSHKAVLELDVPCVATGSGGVRQMFSLGSQLAALLNARLVDDNGRPIDAQSLGAIEAQLEALYQQMRDAGIDPGGLRARRLYI